MHQPFYEDLVTGEHILPWVRLHALKDYYGMVALLREFPDVRVTFNLVPSLLVQLEAFAEDRAHDRFLELASSRPTELTDDDIALHRSQNFFHAQRQRMIDIYPRYARAAGAARRHAADRADVRAAARRFSRDDLRDLQVWHKLAWIDPFYLDGDPRVRGAAWTRARDFTEEDKRLLRAVELELLNQVIPEYRGRGRPRAGRALDVAVLSSDSAAALRHRHLPADAPATRACRASGSRIPRTPRSS